MATNIIAAPPPYPFHGNLSNIIYAHISGRKNTHWSEIKHKETKKRMVQIYDRLSTAEHARWRDNKEIIPSCVFLYHHNDTVKYHLFSNIMQGSIHSKYTMTKPFSRAANFSLNFPYIAHLTISWNISRHIRILFSLHNHATVLLNTPYWQVIYQWKILQFTPNRIITICTVFRAILPIFR